MSRPRAHWPTLQVAASLTATAYAENPEAEPAPAGWHCQGVHTEPVSGLHWVHWRSEAGVEFVAVRGTATARDAFESFKVFLGQSPVQRVAALERWVQEQLPEAASEGRLVLAGHSLGGMVAKLVAERHRLPALVMNTPGRFGVSYDPEASADILELRTSRDPVSVWGAGVPHTLVLDDPAPSALNLSALHGVYQQLALLERSELASLQLGSPQLKAHCVPEPPPAPPGMAMAMIQAWRSLRQDAQRLAQSAYGVSSSQAPAASPPLSRPRR